MTERKKRKPGAGRPKGSEPVRRNIVAFKGREEFAEWLRELAEKRRLPLSVMIEHAIIDYAVKHGYIDDEESAPKR